MKAWYVLMFTTIVTAQNNLATKQSNSTCSISSSSVEKDKLAFNNLIDNGAKLIYIYLNSTSISKLQEGDFDKNRLLEWIWVVEDYKHILSYPVYIDLFTFCLMENNVTSITINVELNNSSSCLYGTDMKLYEYLRKFRMENSTGEYFCHRTLEGQSGRMDFLINISAVSFGYNFECFHSNGYILQKNVVTKSIIISITCSIMIAILFFYPLFLSIAFHKKEADESKNLYHRSQYPYSLYRMCNHILFSGGSFRVCAIRLSIMILAIFTCICIVTENKRKTCMPDYVDKFPTVYQLGIYDLDFSFILLFPQTLFISIVNVLIICYSQETEIFLLLDFRCVTIFRTLPVSMFKNNFTEKTITLSIIQKIILVFSPRFWSSIFRISFGQSPFPLYTEKNKILLYIISVIQFPINVSLILLFAFCPIVYYNFIAGLKFSNSIRKKIKKHLFSILQRKGHIPLRLKIYVVFMYIFHYFFQCMHAYFFCYFMISSFAFHGMSFFVQFFVYTTFVALPHFSTNQFRVFFLLIAAITCIFRYVIDILDFYKLLLDKIIDIEKTDEVSARAFKMVVRKIFPKERKIFFLVIKMVLTGSLFTICAQTLLVTGFRLGGSMTDISTLIGILLVASPKILEKYFGVSGLQEINGKHHEISDVLRQSRPINYDDNIDSSHTPAVVLPHNSSDKNIFQSIKAWCKGESRNDCCAFLFGCCVYDHKERRCIQCKDCCSVSIYEEIKNDTLPDGKTNDNIHVLQTFKIIPSSRQPILNGENHINYGEL